MLIYVDLMAAAPLEAGLEQRLERLTGEQADCCVPEYAKLAAEIRATPRFQRAVGLARVVSDDRRLLALELLRRRKELCACEIQAALGLSHPTVSHHMGILVRAGLVRARREGKWLYYRRARSGGVELP
jgi:DNA-binding transcriptional ArsR family regulator